MFFLLVISYKFRLRHHLQGAYTKISSKPAAINSLQRTYICCDGKSAVKSKVHSRTSHENPEGEQKYRSTISSTSVLDEDGWQTSNPGRFTPGKDPVPTVQEADWVPGPVWTGAENLAATRIRSTDLPERSESLYLLRYPGPPIVQVCGSIKCADKSALLM